MTASWIRLAALAAGMGVLTGCSQLVYQADNYLYIRNASATDRPFAYRSNEVGQAFAKARAEGKPVVLFIHGRGDEPKKSMAGNSPYSFSYWFDSKGLAVLKLEEAYDVSVVMLSWDSRRSTGYLNANFIGRCRPLAKAQIGAEHLRSVVNELSGMPASERPKIVLLAHSMGTWVVKNYIDELKERFPPGLFTSVILSSADVDNVGHERWVRLVAETTPVYITTNTGDRTLSWAECSCRTPGAKPLGVVPGRMCIPGVVYEQFPATRQHEIFHPTSAFYKAVLKGGTWPAKD
jgi:hypothetical protein